MPAPVRKCSSFEEYPAVLAICSDLDETLDADTYFEILRFLNTTEDTRMGPGVGLEVGNTLYFDMPAGHFSYWNSNDADRAKIRALIRSGHIDCLHSYGDLATTRVHAGRALDELVKHDCSFRVWIDHATAVTNFGPDIMRGRGDDPAHPAYHADLTFAHGIQYVWRGRVTSVIGQNRPFSLRGIANRQHPAASAKTLLKELVKQIGARAGYLKYRAHSGNRLLREVVLRDGRCVPEFIRCHPSWAGVSGHDRGDCTHEVITRRYLDRLTRRGGPSIFYTHLGKLERSGNRRVLPRATVAAFRLLAEYQRQRKILVTTTARLLQFHAHGRTETQGYIALPRLEFPSLQS